MVVEDPETILTLLDYTSLTAEERAMANALYMSWDGTLREMITHIQQTIRARNTTVVNRFSD